jgi:hypothetical protein
LEWEAGGTLHYHTVRFVRFDRRVPLPFGALDLWLDSPSRKELTGWFRCADSREERRGESGGRCR